MGNSESTYPNIKTVTQSINREDFLMDDAPLLPNEWGDRINLTVWKEFTDLCRNALPVNTLDRHTEYRKLKRVVSRCIIAIILLVPTGIAAAVYGFTQDVTGLGIVGIILAAGTAFFAGFWAWGHNKSKNIIKNAWIKDIRSDVETLLIYINNKYTNIIEFSLKPYDPQLFGGLPSKLDFEIRIHTDYVAYIPDEGMKSINT